MKTRSGFVSNSSSSSFICDLCGDLYYGPDEYPPYVCENGHKLCSFKDKCVPKGEKLLHHERDEYYFNKLISKENCPLCSMESFSASEQLKYFMKLHRLKNESDVIEFIKKKVGNYDKFKKLISDIKTKNVRDMSGDGA